MQPPGLDLTPFEDFESASRAVLAWLHHQLGFRLWMMTRTDGNDWTVLQTEDHGYDVPEGTVFRWADSFCSRMIEGLGPRAAPVAASIEAYRAAPISQYVPIGAYIGVPVYREDGTLFGTLCAIDPEPMDESIVDHLPLVELMARLLGTVLAFDIMTTRQARQLERVRQQAITDELTGLLNRRGWEQQVAAEESRARRYGNPACVIMIDLDDLKEVNDTLGHPEGDALIRRAAECLSRSVRDSDIVARPGGDEFSVLAVECNLAGGQALHDKISATFEDNGINASVGLAIRDPKTGFDAAIAAADRAMYAEKERRRTGRGD